jgi:anti-anti-sigma factor
VPTTPNPLASRQEEAPGLLRSGPRARASERNRVERIIVDLNGLQFIDSIGMAALGRIETNYGTEGFDPIRAPDRVQRAIALTGLERVLPFLN